MRWKSYKRIWIFYFRIVDCPRGNCTTTWSLIIYCILCTYFTLSNYGVCFNNMLLEKYFKICQIFLKYENSELDFPHFVMKFRKSNFVFKFAYIKQLSTRPEIVRSDLQSIVKSTFIGTRPQINVCLYPTRIQFKLIYLLFVFRGPRTVWRYVDLQPRFNKLNSLAKNSNNQRHTAEITFNLNLLIHNNVEISVTNFLILSIPIQF